jgi:sodium-dependent dicarboxylate transporter 2/3/5|tara:strand:+ start:1217 stop:1513 length:297 start_codon:yes stop_codon:yes gene_type:complete
MSFGLPFSIIIVAVVYFVFIKLMFPCKDIVFTYSENVIDEEIEKLGEISKKEKRVLTIFEITVSLWITRTIINNIFPGLKLSDTIISLMVPFLCLRFQ